MQLKHIKLAGFKSFVDATRISFPTNLVAVVGPNGCGKSNVIDAVKWVLGELSAKNLRGDSMSDVIFNGSDLRKPSGQCSIELLFDNSSATLGGEYAAYNEISIKRSMTRDSQSTYFINNTKCRRKDVQDLFLGTGLGPNSYAIIEQGMVSNLVTAKPEELRLHIEEAAGVSKYRERRKETERRIKNTKENLARVKDIKDEISRLIKRLEGQAKAAEKYNELKKHEKDTELKVSILFSLEAKNNRDEIQKKLDKVLRDQTIKDAETKTKQAQIDEYRTQHESVRDLYDEAQKNFYSVGADIAKHQADLQNLIKSELTNKTALEKVKKSYDEALDKENNLENLSPKEKAIYILDNIINALQSLGTSGNSIYKNALELKEQLKSILNIASVQSKSLTAEYLSRQDDLTILIKESESTKVELEQIISELVQKSSNAETALTKIRQEQSVVDAELRKLENARSIAELDLRSISEKVTQIKLDLKTSEINLQNSNESIKKSGINIDDINYSDYEDYVLGDLQDELANIQTKIIKLGAINLAAPEEIADETKRKDKLEDQYNELTDALEKLTNAIKKIDLETKTRFEDSFNSVNDRLKQIFPLLFGGGFAELKLEDDDALNGGVVFMARPPGKKNASISQLSGGEKALTALSLVFSIFQLNPAPFCMLDEVDAPLDDVNTQRLINMVEEMSKTIQFIFITHNKVSMERSDHLMGITMQEAGVSRLVSVDVNQALEMANTE